MRPISDVRKRRIAPAKFAVRAKLNHPSTFADRCFEPDGIFALGDQLNGLRVVRRWVERLSAIAQRGRRKRYLSIGAYDGDGFRKPDNRADVTDRETATDGGGPIRAPHKSDRPIIVGP